MALADQHAETIIPGMVGVTDEEVQSYLQELSQWQVQGVTLEREYKFSDFSAAMAFVNRVAGIAEAENHHPDIHISYNKVCLQLSTHKIGRLSKNDFIVAAKADRASAER